MLRLVSKAIFSILARVIGISLIAWIAYNELVGRLPEYHRPPLAGPLGIAPAMIYVGVKWWRQVVAEIRRGRPAAPMRPNSVSGHGLHMRVQRTRVLLPAVARRAPPTRRPLGRLKAQHLLSAIVILAAVGCVLPSYMKISRFPLPSDEMPLQPLLMVRALDINGMPLPGVEVSLQSDDAAYPMKFTSGIDGVARPTVGPGQWKITLSLQGFRSVSKIVSVQSGERCVVEGYLRLADQTGDVTVA
jgi:hypothetical protein